MEISDCFKIGYVARSHGLRGEVTIVLGPECPDLKSLKSIYIDLDKQLVPHFIESFSLKGTKAYLKLEDVNTHEMASAMRGCSLYLPKQERPKLMRGEFYNDEVAGFEVVEGERGLLGNVLEVFEMGPNRYLKVIHSEKEVMIPLNGPFIKSINKAKKKIFVELPEGFLDI